MCVQINDDYSCEMRKRRIKVKIGSITSKGSIMCWAICAYELNV